jgi:hypothetical protein
MHLNFLKAISEVDGKIAVAYTLYNSMALLTIIVAFDHINIQLRKKQHFLIICKYFILYLVDCGTVIFMI